MKVIARIFIALLVLPAAVAVAQDKPDALKNYRLGRDLEAQGRMTEANDSYERAVVVCKEELATNPSNMDSYTVLTWCLLRQKKYAETVDWGLKALKANQSEYRVTETLGEAYFYQTNYRESLKMMQHYVDSAPQGDRASVAYFFMGEIYRNTKRYQYADIAYTTAVNLEGGLSLWWYRLGWVREMVGEKTTAAAAYERALKLSPGNKEAAEGLSRMRS